MTTWLLLQWTRLEYPLVKRWSFAAHCFKSVAILAAAKKNYKLKKLKNWSGCKYQGPAGFSYISSLDKWTHRALKVIEKMTSCSFIKVWGLRNCIPLINAKHFERERTKMHIFTKGTIVHFSISKHAAVLLWKSTPRSGLPYKAFVRGCWLSSFVKTISTFWLLRFWSTNLLTKGGAEVVELFTSSWSCMVFFWNAKTIILSNVKLSKILRSNPNHYFNSKQQLCTLQHFIKIDTKTTF